MRSIFGWACAGLMLANIAAAARADEFDDLAKTLDANHAKLKSLRAKTSMTANYDMGAAKTTHASSGTMEWMHQGEKEMFRVESRSTTINNMSGTVDKLELNTTMVSDGIVMCSLNEYLSGPQKGHKMFAKMPAKSVNANLSDLKKDHVVKLLPDEKIGGQTCAVIESRAKDKDGKLTDNNRNVFYYRKDLGMPVKTLTYAGDKLQATSETTDLELNPSLSADRFKLPVPADAQVMDMTNTPQDQGTSGDANMAKKPDDKKPDEPKPEEKPKSKLPKFPRLP